MDEADANYPFLYLAQVLQMMIIQKTNVVKITCYFYMEKYNPVPDLNSTALINNLFKELITNPTI
jgi:hypothetical protein